MNGYDVACGAVVFEMLMAFPAKLAAILISVALFILGLSTKDIKLLIDIFSDFDAYSKLSLLDLLDTNDSNACAIASNPEEAFILFGAEIKNSGTRK